MNIFKEKTTNFEPNNQKKWSVRNLHIAAKRKSRPFGRATVRRRPGLGSLSRILRELRGEVL